MNNKVILEILQKLPKFKNNITDLNSAVMGVS